MSTPNSKLSEQLNVEMHEYDPGDTAADEVNWVAVENYTHFLFVVFHSVGTGNVTYQIVGNTAADGTGTDYNIGSAGSSDIDAVGDYAFLECIHSDIAAVEADNGAEILGVALQVACATGTDELVVTTIRGGAPRYVTAALTTDNVA